jgi:hypothetical protein
MNISLHFRHGQYGRKLYRRLWIYWFRGKRHNGQIYQGLIEKIVHSINTNKNNRYMNNFFLILGYRIGQVAGARLKRPL